MLRKAKVLFLAADPFSLSGEKKRLELDRDVKKIQSKMREAEREYGRTLEFVWELAVRTDELTTALRNTDPAIVHFSGHGGEAGLILMAPDGYEAQQVDPATLTQIFRVYRNRVRVVVLSACYSKPQAEAVANVVGCAIGTPGRIMDDAAIQFNAEFYRAIASGESVQAAFNQASVEFELSGPQGTRPELIPGKGVDPSRLFLVPRSRRLKWAAGAAIILACTAGILQSVIPPPPESPPLRGLQLGDCSSTGTAPLAAALYSAPVAATADAGGTSTAEPSLAQAKALCRAGEYDSAVAHFNRASAEGSTEAMAFLAIAYLSGEGVAPDTQKAMGLLNEAGKKERNPAAMNALAIIYEGDRQFYLAGHWYEEAVKKGYVEAMRNLARLHRTGRGVSRSDSLALGLLQQAVAAGSVDALADIGQLYEEGLSGRRNIREALRFYDSAAAAGSGLGMYMMGRMYQAARDYGLARTLYLRGACHGSAEAMNNLGVLYEKGLGVKSDKGEAIRWFRYASQAGSTAAEANLARLDADRTKRLGWLSRPDPRIPPECEQLQAPAGVTDTGARISATP
jgi:TPR repeat protein